MAKTQTATRTRTAPAMPLRVPQRVAREADRSLSRSAVARAARATEPAIEDEPEDEVTLKPRTIRLIDGIRAPFRAHLSEFVRMHSKAEDLAPEFMRAFIAYQADTGSTFVNFVRYLDPDVPSGPGQPYKSHSTYMAADYLRRLVAAPQGETVENPDAPAGMSEAFVRLLAAVIALIPGNQVERLWTIIETELKWTTGRVTKLRAQVEEAEPLVPSHVEHNSLVVDEP